MMTDEEMINFNEFKNNELDEREAYKKEIVKLKENNYQLLKRLNSIEKERLEEVSAQNEKIISLHSQIVKLRSDNERSAASYQEIELELARSRKSCRDLERSLTTKDQQLKTVDENHDSIDELRSRLEKKSQELEIVQLTFAQKEEELSGRLDQLNKNMDFKRNQIVQLEKEREKLVSNLNEIYQKLESTKQSTQNISAERTRLEANLKERESEIKNILEENQKWKQEQDVIIYKIHRMEECFQAERDAHLESKYNAELVQLRLNETQTAFDQCQISLDNANQVIEIMTYRLKEAEIALEEEAKTAKQCRTETENAKNNPEIQKTKDELEMEKKRSVELSSTLEENNTKMADLQKELNQIKKKQEVTAVEHEELLQEIQCLTENYFDKLTGGSRTSTPIPNSNSSSGNRSTRQLVDQLKTLIQNQARRIQEANEEIQKHNKANVPTLKETKVNKEKSHRELDSQLSNYSSASNTKEMNQMRKRLGEMEKIIVDLQQANSNYKKTIDKDKKTGAEKVEENIKTPMRRRDGDAIYSTPVRLAKPQDDPRDKMDREKSPKKSIPKKVNSQGEHHTGDPGFCDTSQMSWPQMKEELYDGVTHLVEMLLIRHQKENSVDMNNSQIHILNRTVPEKDQCKSKQNLDKPYRYKTLQNPELNQRAKLTESSVLKNRKMKQNIILEDKTRACCCGDTERSSQSSAQKCSSCLLSMN